MTSVGHLLPIAPEECRLLLAGGSVGRVAWVSARGLLLLPVSYVWADDRVLIRVSASSVLAELADGHDVAFEVEDLDEGTLNGWSVLVQGRSGATTADHADLPTPWAPGVHGVVVAITPVAITGRSVSAD